MVLVADEPKLTTVEPQNQTDKGLQASTGADRIRNHRHTHYQAHQKSHLPVLCTCFEPPGSYPCLHQPQDRKT